MSHMSRLDESMTNLCGMEKKVSIRDNGTINGMEHIYWYVTRSVMYHFTA